MNRSNRESAANDPSTAARTKDSGRDQQVASRLQGRQGTTGDDTEVDDEQGISNRPGDDDDSVTDAANPPGRQANSQTATGQRGRQIPSGGQKPKGQNNPAEQAGKRQGGQAQKSPAQRESTQRGSHGKHER